MNFDAHKLLLELVRTPSVSGEEDALAEHVMELLASWSIDATRIGSSVVATLSRGTGPRLLFNSHLDTVPACAGWIDDPWDVEWKAERLTGLGANDAKGCVTAMLSALYHVRDVDFQGTVQLALTACEETTNRGMTEVLEVIGKPELAVTGEPTGLQVVRTQAGLGVLKASWHGRACHAAHAVRVDHSNAMLTAATEIAQLESAWSLAPEHELIGATTVVPTTLHAGERRNVVPDLAEAHFDVRLAPPMTAKAVRDELASKLPQAEVSIFSDRLPAVETAADHPLVVAALRATGNTEAIGSPTLSDMALLSGVPAVKCGPGQTERSHTPNEYLEAAELSEACDAYLELTRQLLAT